MALSLHQNKHEEFKKLALTMTDYELSRKFDIRERTASYYRKKWELPKPVKQEEK